MRYHDVSVAIAKCQVGRRSGKFYVCKDRRYIAGRFRALARKSPAHWSKLNVARKGWATRSLHAMRTAQQTWPKPTQGLSHIELGSTAPCHGLSAPFCARANSRRGHFDESRGCWERGYPNCDCGHANIKRLSCTCSGAQGTMSSQTITLRGMPSSSSIWQINEPAVRSARHEARTRNLLSRRAVPCPLGRASSCTVTLRVP